MGTIASDLDYMLSLLSVVAEERGLARHCMAVKLELHDRSPIAMHI